MKSRYLPVFIMGFSSILLQIVCLQRLLTVFSGNELDIGITISVWLLSVGVGSYAGRRIRSKGLFALLFLALALLTQPTDIFIGLIRTLLHVEFGETLSLGSTVLFTFLSLFPLCIVIGMQFPAAVSHTERNAARVYAMEAAGAVIGGLIFVAAISGRVDSLVIFFLVSLLNLFTGIVILRRKWLISLLFVPLAFFAVSVRLNAKAHLHGAQVIERIQSRYGEITAIKIRGQKNIYASGRFQFAYPDIQTEEIKSHLPLSACEDPSNVLVAGGSPALIREILKYPVKHIDFIELDPAMINLSLRLLSQEDRNILKDKRVQIIAEDARRFIKKAKGRKYDLVLINLPEPATANINRFYTIGFFQEVRDVLQKDGIISLTLPTSSGYIGRHMQVANGSVYTSLKQIFLHMAVSSEEYGYIFASQEPIKTDPDTLVGRFERRKIATGYFRPYILKDAFDPLKVSIVNQRLSKISDINSDSRPVSYLYNLMLWAEVSGGKTLNTILGFTDRQISIALVGIFLLLGILLLMRRSTVYFSIFTTGYSTMAFSVMIILAFQSAFGYVYEMIGLLSAVYMAGAVFGAFMAHDLRFPLKWLRLQELVAIALFLSTPLLLLNEPLFYLLNFINGMIGGTQFAAANLCMARQANAGEAGKLYGIDLAGSFTGALLASVFLMPMLGSGNMLLLLAVIKTVSFSFLMVTGHGKS